MSYENNPTFTGAVQFLQAFQLSNRPVWLISVGRFLSQIGAGLIYFYIPLVFVNQVGLSATAVGISVGLSSLTGVVGHFLGGILVDSPQFGRKPTLMLSAVLGIVVSLTLAVADSVPLLVVASLILGVSVGFYWTAADAALMDVTTPQERHQAFAIGNLANNVGNGAGILGGGALLLLCNDNHALLFAGCGLIYLVFWAMVQTTMPETYTPHEHQTSLLQGIGMALRDRALLVFILANLLFTTYIALVNSTIPLYFTNFVPAIGDASVAGTARLFTWCYIGVGAVLQLPLAHLLNGWPRVRVLMLALLMWALGFCLVWFTGVHPGGQFGLGMVALCWLSVGAVIYVPFASAIVAELAPAALRGAYVAVSSQCWAIGYFVGPILGGWAMDQTPAIAHTSWLVASGSTLFGVGILCLFGRIYQVQLAQRHSQDGALKAAAIAADNRAEVALADSLSEEAR